jgi:hypothetical protein
MGDVEDKRTEQEARSQATAPMTSRRAEVWSAMMRYLSGEAAREQSRAEKERSRGERGRKGRQRTD